MEGVYMFTDSRVYSFIAMQVRETASDRHRFYGRPME